MKQNGRSGWATMLLKIQGLNIACCGGNRFASDIRLDSSRVCVDVVSIKSEMMKDLLTPSAR